MQIEMLRARNKYWGDPVWYWVLKASNGKILAKSEMYKKRPRKLVEKLAEDIQKGVPVKLVDNQ